jgi:hypothetical protein
MAAGNAAHAREERFLWPGRKRRDEPRGNRGIDGSVHAGLAEQ